MLYSFGDWAAEFRYIQIYVDMQIVWLGFYDVRRKGATLFCYCFHRGQPAPSGQTGLWDRNALGADSW